MSLGWLLFIPLLALAVVKSRLLFKNNVPLPPGPPGDPLIGHIRSIPAHNPEMYFYKLGLKYGDVVHLRVLGQSMIILNSVQAAVELLDKRGVNYSNRPRFYNYEIMGWELFIAYLSYGAEWRKQRAMIQHYFSKEKAKEYYPIQIREARTLTRSLLSSTEDKLKQFIRFSTAIIIDINYGHQIVSDDDPYVEITANCSRVAAESGPPGSTPIDLLPFLRHFPSWFPGTYYATFARTSSHMCRMLLEYPYNKIREKMDKEAVRPSFLASLLEDMHKNGSESETDIKRAQAVTAVTYIAGADTTASTLSFFLLAMVLHPEFQIKAQEEIDRVVGPGRLPEFQDKDKLPFVGCILQETLRWRQTIPAGVPHKSAEDDIYNGMFIPKGSLVFANSRGISLDETVYKEPSKFNPARFLPSPEGRSEPHPVAQFGFGRRICPGRHLAEDSIWIAMATILATTSILKAIGADGKEIVPEDTPITTGITSHARPFLCDIRPRRTDALHLLQQSMDSC